MTDTRDVARSLVRRLRYEVHSNRNLLGDAADKVRDVQCYQRYTSPTAVFSPWEGHYAFEELFDGVEAHTIVSRDRCYLLASLAQHAAGLTGDAAECGVYNGGTALLLSRILADNGHRLYLFDSFAGLPQGDPDKDGHFRAGQYASDPVESVRALLAEFGDSGDIRAGWIPDTFAGLEDRRYVLAHVDVDIYQSTRDCCEYFYPRLVPGGVMVFDEYGRAPARGERDAVDEFFADKPETPIALPTGQAMVLKLPEQT